MYFAWNIVSYLLLCCTSIALTSKREEHLVGMFGDTLYKWSPTVDGNEKVSGMCINLDETSINQSIIVLFVHLLIATSHYHGSDRASHHCGGSEDQQDSGNLLLWQLVRAVSGFYTQAGGLLYMWVLLTAGHFILMHGTWGVRGDACFEGRGMLKWLWIV